MRMVMFAITLAAMGLGGWLYAMSSAPTTPRRAAVAHLRTTIPPETESDVRLDGCTLQVKVVATNQTGHVDVTDLSINLKLYNTDQIRISQLGTGTATYVAPRVGVNDAYLDQALRLIAADGADGFANTKSLTMADGDLSLNALSHALNKPNAQLVFGLSSSIKQREDGTSQTPGPSARAPEFDSFVDKVAGLDPPANYLATRRYMDDKREGAGLLTGSLRLPDHIEFAFPDKDIAHAFADVMRVQCVG
ncbi:MAG: hypothetical protein AAFY06_12135, partial [Pseudomonadota bacterium]